MTNDELKKLAHGDLDVTLKLARTIRPVQDSGRQPGPVLSQFTRFTKSTAEEAQRRYGSDLIPDPTNPRAEITSRRRGEVLPVPEHIISRPQLPYGPVDGQPISVNHENIFDERPYAVEGDYAEMREEMDAYNAECQERFRATVMQLYPTLPELWMMPRPASGEAPKSWGLERAALYDVERKLKTQYRRVAADATQRLAIRKAAAQIAQGFEVDDPKFRAALRRHNANLAARELLRDHTGDPTYRLALQGLISDESVPASERVKARRELQALGEAL